MEWTKEELKDLKRLYPRLANVELAEQFGRPVTALRKKASRLGLRKSRRYMKSIGRAVVILLVLCLCSLSYGQDPNGPIRFFTTWTLIGTNPEFGKSEEMRIGYEGLLPDLEIAASVVHLEAPDTTVDSWSGRVYGLWHALDANMVASFLGNGIELPKGNLYGGLFGQYSYDREEEWSGGYVVGGLVDWPAKWQTVGEFQSTVWNTTDNGYAFVVGLRKKF